MVTSADDLPRTKVVDVHLTPYSTCATEAPLFGTLSVIAHANGKRADGRFLDQGMMRFAATLREVPEELEPCMEVSHEPCVEASSPLFAPPAQTLRVLDSILKEAAACV
jgi:hypothetical protein